MLTNWKTIKIPINKLLEYEENKSSGQLEGMIKKEAVMLEKEMKKLSLNFDGVKDMKGLPDALFVIDVENENIAVQEALKMGIPVFGLVDTNSNPTNLSNFIPINDDSSKTIRFVLDLLSEAILEGQDSARKQGLVQKLDGDKGPKVFSLNVAAKATPKPDDKSSKDASEEVAEVEVSEEKDDALNESAAKKAATTKKPAAKKAATTKKPAAKKAATTKKPAAKKAATTKKPAAKKAATTKKPAAKKQPQPKSQQPKKQPQPKSQQPKKQPQPKSRQSKIY